MSRPWVPIMHDPDFPEGFELKRQLGTGTSADVFLAEDVGLRRAVALKRLGLDSEIGSVASEMAVHEGRALASVRNEFIGQVYDVIPTPDAVWIVMEYVRGPTLQSLLDSGTSIPRSRAILWIWQLACALEATADAGIIHRDIKPANIIINRDWDARLVDFGIAFRAGWSADSLGRWLDGAGTPAFMAPEQIRQPGSVSPLTDIYALGVIGFLLLTGQHPFQAATGDVTAMLDAQCNARAPAPRSMTPETTRRLSRLLHKTLEKDPARRPSPVELRSGLAREL